MLNESLKDDLKVFSAMGYKVDDSFDLGDFTMKLLSIHGMRQIVISKGGSSVLTPDAQKVSFLTSLKEVISVKNAFLGKLREWLKDGDIAIGSMNKEKVESYHRILSKNFGVSDVMKSPMGNTWMFIASIEMNESYSHLVL